MSCTLIIASRLVIKKFLMISVRELYEFNNIKNAKIAQK